VTLLDFKREPVVRTFLVVTRTKNGVTVRRYLVGAENAAGAKNTLRKYLTGVNYPISVQQEVKNRFLELGQIKHYD
jgi:hypothetical protein